MTTVLPTKLAIPVVEPTRHPKLELALRHKLDHKAQPIGSLGRLESLALQLGLIQGSTTIDLRQPQMVVFAADHGLVDEWVSASTQEATLQTVLNMMRGGTAVNVLARQHGFGLTLVDAGVASAIPDAGDCPTADITLVRRKIGFGTRNMARGPAMTGAQTVAAMNAGFDVVSHLPGNVVAFGDVGVGNTCSAALILSRLCMIQLDDVVGTGTGLNDHHIEHKLRVLFDVARKHHAAISPLEALTAMGGFEIAMMAGAMLQAASERRVVLVDGFGAGAAALVAMGLRPAAADYMVFAHRSAEAGHRHMLIHMQAQPLLDLEMRLGDGTGALLAWPLVCASALLMNQMADAESSMCIDANVV